GTLSMLGGPGFQNLGARFFCALRSLTTKASMSMNTQIHVDHPYALDYFPGEIILCPPLMRSAMRTWTKYVAVIAAALGAVGCGTFFNTVGAPCPERAYRAYGGVRADFGPCANILDVPFSLVGDTITLPVTAPYSLYRLIDRPTENAYGGNSQSELRVPPISNFPDDNTSATLLSQGRMSPIKLLQSSGPDASSSR